MESSQVNSGFGYQGGKTSDDVHGRTNVASAGRARAAKSSGCEIRLARVMEFAHMNHPEIASQELAAVQREPLPESQANLARIESMMSDRIRALENRRSET